MKENILNFFGSKLTAFALKFFSNQIINKATDIKTHSNGEKKTFGETILVVKHMHSVNRNRDSAMNTNGHIERWAAEIFYKIFSALRPFAVLEFRKLLFIGRGQTRTIEICVFFIFWIWYVIPRLNQSLGTFAWNFRQRNQRWARGLRDNNIFTKHTIHRVTY